MAKSEQVNVYLAPEVVQQVKQEAEKSSIPSVSLMMAILTKEALEARKRRGKHAA